ncbi:HIRAN domain-containing protein [Thiomicrorhabdus sp. ZW0627]|uniref:HIRAN domain-containing protein n=1 Tax=Thiomicrorhabdus sp. ZW0627 TaxID=3039774 RepID=UPI0024371B90|nr:HIRAN domain-containing protein [Thiomicrorhabdus sp. ZW0627]MDG6773989.1 HIRAN domain-containing protein [Thiomicrorhabdus sp. ZW0627]
MKRRYRFPVKGSYYYSADEAFYQGLIFNGQTVTFKPEPENPHDKHAMQIWYFAQPDDGYLLGYLPRQLARYWQPALKRKLQNHPDDIRLTLSKAVARGKLLRLECSCELDFNWLQHLYFLWLSFWIRQTHRLNFLRPNRQIRHSRPD